ncbi:HlyD family efflux transporter periplasmic adaptor subunit [Paenibacillus sp. KACC 21273]|uniref:HlyD family efflux transporter periplasmic adaptor subunit n=1 Tax=Paenibacillus kyungheensis TaxID=1452732 RepID=A0AAX3M339_9BACL|nr:MULTISPECIES: HlyD family efflux transporter periplasmic adaptor subunit [Paenibacillus]WCT56672.1 HlyD family efflux transporter periplasmic adaptor subunit [Paenibacillus kyungheensis]WDF50225.1 HlyD family efflux transporter periplasmic adaptor subunit [Paenibacillus sp. KACC 21273]
MRRKIVLSILIVLLVISGGTLGYYYWYQGTHFVKTEDARISATQYKVMPQITAELNHIDVEEGDVLKRNEPIAEQDVSGLDSSMISKSVLRSPIDGTVLKVYSKEHEIGTPSSPVAIVADMNDLYVSTNIEETDINRVKAGQVVDVSLDADGDYTIQGKIRKIGEASNSVFATIAATNTSGNFNKVTQRIPVEIALNVPKDLKLIPGTNVVVKIHTS